jgi:hypothetical protein
MKVPREPYQITLPLPWDRSIFHLLGFVPTLGAKGNRFETLGFGQANQA